MTFYFYNDLRTETKNYFMFLTMTWGRRQKITFYFLQWLADGDNKWLFTFYSDFLQWLADRDKKWVDRTLFREKNDESFSQIKGLRIIG